MRIDVIKSVGWQWFAVLLCSLLSFVVTATVARSLGASGYGLYSVAISFGSLILIILEGGFRIPIQKSFSRTNIEPVVNANTLLGNALLINLFSTSIIIIVLGVFAGSMKELCIITVILFSTVAATNILSAKNKGKGAFGFDAIFITSQRIFSALLIYCVIWLYKSDPETIIMAWSIGNAAALLLYKGELVRPKFAHLLKNLKITWNFFIIDASIATYIRSGVLLLGFYQINSDMIGQYSAAFKVCEIYLMFLNPIGSIFLGRLIKYADFSKRVFANFGFNIFCMLMLGSIVCGVTWFLSDDLISVIFGNNFELAPQILQSLSLMLIFVYGNMFLNQIAISIGAENVIRRISIFAAIISLVFNLIFVPAIGIYSLVVCAVLTEFLFFITLLISITNRKHLY